MTSGWLGVLLGLATLALAHLAGEVVMLAADRAAARGWLDRLGPRTRAGLLLQARLAPLSCAALAVPLVALAFWRFEPSGVVESPGPILPLLSMAGAWLTGSTARRAWRTARTTRALDRAWRAAGERTRIPGWSGDAWVVGTPFPVVAVVGCRRPVLFVARDVVAGCTPAELAVIAAHERAHVESRDNLARMAFAWVPDVTGAGARLEDCWSDAAETLADLRARHAGDGLTLAQALTRVARMAAGPVPSWPVSALIDAGAIETRVRRLLAPASAPGRSPAGVPTVAVAPLAAAAALLALPTVYEAAEWLVRLGR